MEKKSWISKSVGKPEQIETQIIVEIKTWEKKAREANPKVEIIAWNKKEAIRVQSCQR